MLQGLFSSQAGTLTVEGCASLCQTSGYTMAAMEYGEECYCGSQLVTTGGIGVATDASECNMPCSGKSFFLMGFALDTDLF